MMQDQEPVREDHFITVAGPAQGEYKEKGSKFLSFCFPVSRVEDTREVLGNLRKEYPDARHHCFAYRLDPEMPQVRASDDGEPSHSAGMPLFNQLLSFGVWNTMVVVVRYFGGTKLGVAGLMNAYKTAAADALDKADRKTVFIRESFSIQFPYDLMNEVMRIIREEELEITEERMGTEAGYRLAVRKSKWEKVKKRIGNLHHIKISYL